MSAYAEGAASARYEGCAEAQPLEFVTAFRSGTGGLRVAVFDDCIVTYRRDGLASELQIGDIIAVSTFEGGASHPAYGVQLEVKSPPRDLGYRFDDDATRLAFLRAVRRRMRRDTA